MLWGDAGVGMGAGRITNMGSAAGAAGASLAASLCCVGPLAITLLGVHGAIFAAGIFALFPPGTVWTEDAVGFKKRGPPTVLVEGPFR